MDIQLSQADLMQAVKDFICKKGLTQPVESIRFTATRSGQGVITDIRIADGNPEAPSQSSGLSMTMEAEAEVIPAAEQYPNLRAADPEDIETRQSSVEDEPESGNVAFPFLDKSQELSQESVVTDEVEEGPTLFPKG